MVHLIYQQTEVNMEGGKEGGKNDPRIGGRVSKRWTGNINGMPGLFESRMGVKVRTQEKLSL